MCILKAVCGILSCMCIFLVQKHFYVSITGLFMDYLLSKGWQPIAISILRAVVDPQFQGLAMALFIFTTQMVGMIYPVILAWCQQELGLSEPLDHPTRFGFFLTFATCVPNMLSIPCFYFSGNRYVEHKKKEEAFIEAAESF